MSVTGGDTAADLFGNQEEDDSWLYTDKDNGKKSETEQSSTGGQLYLNDDEENRTSTNAENNELSVNDDAALGELDKTNVANDDNNENKEEDDEDEDEDDEDDDGDDGINIVIDTNKPSSSLLQQQGSLGGPGGLTWQKNKGQGAPGAQQSATAGAGNQAGGKPAQQVIYHLFLGLLYLLML